MTILKTHLQKLKKVELTDIIYFPEDNILFWVNKGVAIGRVESHTY